MEKRLNLRGCKKPYRKGSDKRGFDVLSNGILETVEQSEDVTDVLETEKIG